MKLRSDFVTNSSSSSFIVNLKLTLKDGTALTVNAHEDCGDFDGAGWDFQMVSPTGETIATAGFDPMCSCMENLELMDPDDMPYEVVESISVGSGTIGLLDIAQATTATELIEAVKKPVDFISIYCGEDDEEYEDEYMDEEAAEILQQLQSALEEAAETCTTALEESITDPDDVESASLKLEFSGRGEFLRDAEEILNKVFTWDQSDAIVQALKQEDALEALNQLAFMENFTPDSLEALVTFWQENEAPPLMCDIHQTIQPDGKIRMTISCDAFF